MAKTFLINLIAILSILLIIISHIVISTEEYDHVEDEEEEYVLDNIPFPPHFRSSRSRFLTSIIKKGTQCDQKAHNICNGVSANKGTSLLFCCKTHCRNVLGDRNNCGRCGQKCGHGERCCGGVCTKILHNVNHCGKCNKKCSAGVGCENGFCGYA